MKAITYAITFGNNEDYGNIYFYLRDIISPIRLEVGDKIAIHHASFDRFSNDISTDKIDETMEFLLKKSIKASKYLAYFEISDIVYSHESYDDEFNIHGIITLKGK